MAQPRSSRQPTPRAATSARAAAAALTQPHLEKLYRAVGKQVVQLFFLDQAQRITLAQLSPQALRPIIESTLAEAPAAVTRRGRPPIDLTRARLMILDQAVREAPALDGILISEALSLFRERLGCIIRPGTLREMLRRTAKHHQLIIRGSRVRLRGDILAQMIQAKHAAKMESRLHVMSAPAPSITPAGDQA